MSREHSPQSGFIVYKLLFDGSIFRINEDQVAQHFKNVNIIAVYFRGLKRLYIWRGMQVTHDLAKHIPLIENQILERNPGITILRHFTIEGARQETEEFIGLLQISLEEFEASLKEWDSFYDASCGCRR